MTVQQKSNKAAWQELQRGPQGLWSKTEEAASNGADYAVDTGGKPSAAHQTRAEHTKAVAG